LPASGCDPSDRIEAQEKQQVAPAQRRINRVISGRSIDKFRDIQFESRSRIADRFVDSFSLASALDLEEDGGEGEGIAMGEK